MQNCAARGTGSKPNYLHPPPPWHGIWNGKLYWFIWNESLIIIKPPLPHKMWWNSKFPQVIETIVDRGLEIWETRQQKVEIKRGAKVIVPPRVHCNTGHLRWQDIRADCVSKSVQKVAEVSQIVIVRENIFRHRLKLNQQWPQNRLIWSWLPVYILLEQSFGHSWNHIQHECHKIMRQVKSHFQTFSQHFFRGAFWTVSYSS